MKSLIASDKKEIQQLQVVFKAMKTIQCEGHFTQKQVNLLDHYFNLIYSIAHFHGAQTLSRSKSVIEINKEGKKIGGPWPSAASVSRELSLNPNTVSICIENKYKCKGRIFVWEKEYKEKI